MHTKEFGKEILEEIIYRGEGNSSLVIALKSQAKVIRLLKKDGKIMKSSQDHHVTQHPMRSLQFIHLIMKPLTEPFLSGDMELIHLKSDLINSLSERVEVHRPLHRLDKTLLLDDQFALVMDDLCTLPTELTRHLNESNFRGPAISIEIKPKQGFLPLYRSAMRPSNNHEQFVDKMKGSCLYGSMQHLKLAKGRIKEANNYCPVNLFSGCPAKMEDALKSLINNPQNNLRIFKDLVLAYGESNQSKLSSVLGEFFEPESQLTSSDKSNYEDRLVGLLIQCLLNYNEGDADEKSPTREVIDLENSRINCESCSKHSLDGICKLCDSHTSIKRPKLEHKSTLVHQLPESCVLSSVLRAQRLDTIGVHEALNMLEWLVRDSKLSGGADILEELSKPQVPRGFGSSHPLPNETRQQYYFRKVLEFLVSLTAKDCSIIVTIRRISPEFSHSNCLNYPHFRKHLLKEQESETYYMFNVGIADLDQKMPLKIPRICDNLNSINFNVNC